MLAWPAAESRSSARVSTARPGPGCRLGRRARWRLGRRCRGRRRRWPLRVRRRRPPMKRSRPVGPDRPAARSLRKRRRGGRSAGGPTPGPRGPPAGATPSGRGARAGRGGRTTPARSPRRRGARRGRRRSARPTRGRRDHWRARTCGDRRAVSRDRAGHASTNSVDIRQVLDVRTLESAHFSSTPRTKRPARLRAGERRIRGAAHLRRAPREHRPPGVR